MPLLGKVRISGALFDQSFDQPANGLPHFFAMTVMISVPHPVSWTQVFIKPPWRMRLGRATGLWPARG
jgi:hypothetical protein